MISVCVAAFNGEKYIEEQILSVLRNLDSQDEIIISDDGSSDRTRRIVDDLAEKDRRIRIIDGPRKGLIKNFENAKVKPPNQKFFVFFVRNGGFFGHLCYNVVNREQN